MLTPSFVEIDSHLRNPRDALVIPWSTGEAPCTFALTIGRGKRRYRYAARCVGFDTGARSGCVPSTKRHAGRCSRNGIASKRPTVSSSARRYAGTPITIALSFAKTLSEPLTIAKELAGPLLGCRPRTVRPRSSETEDGRRARTGMARGWWVRGSSATGYAAWRT